MSQSWTLASTVTKTSNSQTSRNRWRSRPIVVTPEVDLDLKMKVAISHQWRKFRLMWRKERGPGPVVRLHIISRKKWRWRRRQVKGRKACRKIRLRLLQVSWLSRLDVVRRGNKSSYMTCQDKCKCRRSSREYRYLKSPTQWRPAAIVATVLQRNQLRKAVIDLKSSDKKSGIHLLRNKS